MQNSNNLLNTSLEENSLQPHFIYETSKQIPGSVHYHIRRYTRPENWLAEDIGMLKYHVEPSSDKKNHLELRFCVAGNMYCRQQQNECRQCKIHTSVDCQEKLESVDILSFVFTATLLSQFIKSRIDSDSMSEEILAFKHTSSFSKTIPLCNRTRNVLEGLLNNTYSDTLENIYVNAQTQMLLLYSMDCMLGEKEINTISCKFLANEDDRQKIIKAREILIKSIGAPITIKELSRKIAMNECYLKKGFKQMFGTTVFDFYQSQRMEHAKYLLYEKGLSVTDVSVLLGYSSISHFSTAFKKHTGLKPCELLFRT
ncbi:MAG TPA: AraC family transcriptional regulator [Chitinophagaceae bacterium]|nr:AraC family transcriptional regulator [Chitinophagaceae bacterium]